MGKKALVLLDGGLHGRDGVGGSLQGEGYAVDVSRDSWQAIQKMKESHYDVAVIDLDLPPVHGVPVTAWDLGRIFRAYNPGISVVFLSGVASKEQQGSWLWMRDDLPIQGKGACAR